MRTIIDTIPHEAHRYSTCGDWYYATEVFCCGWSRMKLSDDDNNCPTCHGPMEERKVLVVLSSKLSDPRREFLIQHHELTEVKLCEQAGVTQEVVDKFDKDFEANRAEDNEDEPGDEPAAPYVRQHCIATGVERLLAAEMGVNWKEYEQELCDLPEVSEKPEGYKPV